MAKKGRGPGTIIKETLAAWGIYANEGCSCHSLALKMNQVGPEEVLANFDEYTKEMYLSVADWRLENHSRLPQPPLFVIRELIRWACNKSIAEKLIVESQNQVQVL